MTDARDVGREIAAAIAAGDMQALASITFELAQRAATAEATVSELRLADQQRREGQNNRKRRSRSRDVTGQSVTSQEVTGQDVTSQPPPSPLPSLLSPTPPYNSSFPPPPRSANGAGESVTDEGLRALVGDAGWPDVARFIETRRGDKRAEWRREMAKLIGPGSQFTGPDLAGACSDALIVDQPLEGPHALRAFIAKRRDERLNPPADRKSAGRGGDGSTFNQRREAEAQEAAKERAQADRNRRWTVARNAATSEWAKAHPDELAAIESELETELGGRPPIVFAGMLTERIAARLGFPGEEDFTGQWVPPLRIEPRTPAPAADPYAAPVAGSSEEDRRLAEGYEEQLFAAVKLWRDEGHEAEYREHEAAVFKRFGYLGKKLTADQQAAVDNAIALRIRDEQGWPTKATWTAKQKRRREARVAVSA